MLQQAPVGVRRRGEPVEHADTRGFERSEHLAQRRVLAADAAHILEGDVREIQRVIGSKDRRRHQFSSSQPWCPS